MYEAERFQVGGLTVQIIADEDAQAPENDDILFIVTTRNRYFELLSGKCDVAEVMENKEFCEGFHIFPLYAYVHSGVSLSLGREYPFNDRWDSGQIGAVFVSKAEWPYRNRDIKRRVSARTSATHYVESWNQYLSGDVWGVVVENTASGEHLDSCWGFYGIDCAKQEAKNMVRGVQA
jgi:hypothetical protein